MLSAREAWPLLAYLALPPGRMHPGDKPTALLWGDVPDSQARAMFTLRQALGESAEFLVQESEGVGLGTRSLDLGSGWARLPTAWAGMPRRSRPSGRPRARFRANGAGDAGRGSVGGQGREAASGIGGPRSVGGLA